MGYTEVTVEGGLLPADLLERIADGDAEGQRPEDFALGSGVRLGDAIQGAFSDARSYWDTFERRQARGRESLTSLTRDTWILPLLTDTLGFELSFQRSATAIGGQSYPISHRAGASEAAPPVHIVSADQPLDRRTGSQRSPHALVQEYLNRSDALWGIVTNGERLRLLRDSARLSRPSFVEFDLRGIVDGNLYSEFVPLFRLLHRSRLPRDLEDAPHCLLERYYQQGVDEGGRVREHLRDGVEKAIEALGNAFLVHPRSEALRESLRGGRLKAEDYYRQLLRLVYRLLFLFVAEERRLLFPAGSEQARLHEIYARDYSLRRLRDRCERPFAGDRHSDLWQGVLRTFAIFREQEMAAKLGLAALNGELFGGGACRDLESAGCENAELLRAVYHLSTFKDRGVRRRVNYAGLDVEELGSVYESLLDFRPHVELGERPRFELVSGGERRQTGSYYTPPSLVHELIESALVPVIEERLAAAARTPAPGPHPNPLPTPGEGDRNRVEAQERALLGLRVCDPASGSGHFLLAAARRIARELAKVRTGEAEPAPEPYRAALRDAIRSCIYAVDKNPLAVDLCKVALWIEGHNAGLPLSFLDNHVKCGDSLTGVFDLGVLEQGIPDEAYTAVADDEKRTASALRKRNKAERAGQTSLQLTAVRRGTEGLAGEFGLLTGLAEQTPADVRAKEERYASLRGPTTDWWTLKTACDLWAAAFFTPLRPETQDLVATTDTLRQYLATPKAAHGQAVGMAGGLSQQLRFFHWRLEFPDVFAHGGFDLILGNPPFAGGKHISGSFGPRFRTYLGIAYAPAGATCDLCAYVYRRAFAALAPAGRLGMVATKTISQGDTREGGLAVIVKEGGTITFARRFIKWPGAANVEVNLLAIRRGGWDGPRLLDGEPVATISSRLDTEPEAEPQQLAQNAGLSFIGSYVLGMGFVLEPEEAEALIAKDQRNRDVLFPYLNGEDLNSRPDQSPSRWVINFHDWPLERAERYPDCMAIVREKVKLERDALGTKGDASAKGYARLWWQFGRKGLGLHAAIAGMERVLVRAQTSELHMPTFVPKGMVYSMMLVVFAFDDDYHFALLQSNVHEAWVRRNASSLRTDLRYTPTDCFETFPFPKPDGVARARVDAAGSKYDEERRRIMLGRRLGLTQTYNLFNNPACRDEDIMRLRELHAEMDRAVLACYGWRDLDPAHGFYANERGKTRFSIAAPARQEVLRRLLALNLVVAAEPHVAARRTE